MTNFYTFDNSYLAPQSLAAVGKQHRQLPVIQSKFGCIILPRGCGKTYLGISLIVNSINTGQYKTDENFRLCFIALRSGELKEIFKEIWDKINTLSNPNLSLDLTAGKISYNNRVIFNIYLAEQFVHNRGLSGGYKFIFADEAEFYATKELFEKLTRFTSQNKVPALSMFPQVLIATSIDDKKNALKFRTFLEQYNFETSE